MHVTNPNYKIDCNKNTFDGPTQNFAVNFDCVSVWIELQATFTSITYPFQTFC